MHLTATRMRTLIAFLHFHNRVIFRIKDTILKKKKKILET